MRSSPSQPADVWRDRRSGMFIGEGTRTILIINNQLSTINFARHRSAVRLFIEQHLQRARVLDWAAGIPLVSLEEVLATTAAK